MIYDLAFLVLFCLGVFWFLYSHRKNLGREGIMYMYRTKWGMMEIESFSKKNSKLLHALKYPIVIVGFSLMAIMIFLLCQTVYTYIAFPQISDIIKAPPVMPLIPYFPQIFGVESLLPPFYFAYFLIALLVVAIVHEFFHGIYMSLFKTKIKSTGFAFLGPILGAFVEEDKKQFYKKKNFEQMVVLGAGVFANILFALIFFVLLIVFFYASYAPSGYEFGDYAYGLVSLGGVSSIIADGNFTKINVGNQSFLYPLNLSEFYLKLNKTNASSIALYFDAPAIRSHLNGAITEINGEKINSQQELASFLDRKKPGDNITITTILKDVEKNYSITLANNPNNESKPFIGISQKTVISKGIMGKIIGKITMFKNPSTYYKSRYNPDLATYFYNLIWWVALINLFVGLFNMLPLGILDGGRFLYLAVLSVSKKEKIAEKSFRYATKAIGLIFLAMMIAWLFSLF